MPPTATPTRPSKTLRLATPKLREEIAGAPAPLAKIGNEYNTLHGKANAAIRHADQLHGRRPAAAASDRATLAAAMRAGKSVPGSEAADELEAEIEMAEREAIGLIDATQSVWQEFKAALIAHAPDWSAEERKKRASLQAAAIKALDEQDARVSEIADSRGLASWIDNAVAAINGDRLGGAVPRRFPRGKVSAPTSVHVNGNTTDITQVHLIERQWLDGGS